jgi:hypothetical protein
VSDFCLHSKSCRLISLVEVRRAQALPPNFAIFDGSQNREEENNADDSVCQARVLEADFLSESDNPEANREGHELSHKGEKKDNLAGLDKRIS